MGRSVNLPEYLANMRALLRRDEVKFGLMVERQVQVRVLPCVSGARAALEPHLWELLVFCLDGHEATAPSLDDATFERAHDAADAGTRMLGEGEAPFPRAAAAVIRTLDTLREVGVFPPPKLK